MPEPIPGTNGTVSAARRRQLERARMMGSLLEFPPGETEPFFDSPIDWDSALVDALLAEEAAVEETTFVPQLVRRRASSRRMGLFYGQMLTVRQRFASRQAGVIRVPTFGFSPQITPLSRQLVFQPNLTASPHIFLGSGYDEFVQRSLERNAALLRAMQRRNAQYLQYAQALVGNPGPRPRAFTQVIPTLPSTIGNPARMQVGMAEQSFIARAFPNGPLPGVATAPLGPSQLAEFIQGQAAVQPQNPSVGPFSTRLNRALNPPLPALSEPLSPALRIALGNPNQTWAQIENIGINNRSRFAASGPLLPNGMYLDEAEFWIGDAWRTNPGRRAVPATQLSTPLPPPSPSASAPTYSNAQRLALGRLTSRTVPRGTAITPEDVYSRFFTLRAIINLTMRRGFEIVTNAVNSAGRSGLRVARTTFGGGNAIPALTIGNELVERTTGFSPVGQLLSLIDYRGPINQWRLSNIPFPSERREQEEHAAALRRDLRRQRESDINFDASNAAYTFIESFYLNPRALLIINETGGSSINGEHLTRNDRRNRDQIAFIQQLIYLRIDGTIPLTPADFESRLLDRLRIIDLVRARNGQVPLVRRATLDQLRHEVLPALLDAARSVEQSTLSATRGLLTFVSLLGRAPYRPRRPNGEIFPPRNPQQPPPPRTREVPVSFIDEDYAEDGGTPTPPQARDMWGRFYRPSPPFVALLPNMRALWQRTLQLIERRLQQQFALQQEQEAGPQISSRALGVSPPGKGREFWLFRGRDRNLMLQTLRNLNAIVERDLLAAGGKKTLKLSNREPVFPPEVPGLYGSVLTVIYALSYDLSLVRDRGTPESYHSLNE